jgi:Plasmid maintenance system antidote protein
MEEMNWTQQQVAEKLGCSQQYVSRMVKGGENLTLEMLSKIEDVLDISEQLDSILSQSVPVDEIIVCDDS